MKYIIHKIGENFYSGFTHSYSQNLSPGRTGTQGKGDDKISKIYRKKKTNGLIATFITLIGKH